MRVAIDGTPLLGSRTGVGEFVAGALAALAARGDVELSAYALSGRGGGALATQLPTTVSRVGGVLPAAPLLAAWAAFGRPSIDRRLGRPDVVHGTNFVVPPCRSGGGAVVTVHDLTPVRFPDLASRRTRLFPTLIRRAIAAGAIVHTPSKFVAAEVVDLLGADPARVVAVAHGVPDLPVGPATSAPPPVDGPYILALGTVEPRKNLVALVRAFDQVAGDHPGLQLVIAGADGWEVQPVEEAIVRARHTRSIVRLGYVQPATRSALMAGATVYAYPSAYEGFGLPPLEAMASGVPVVASTAGALPEVLGDAAFLVDVADLAGALSRVVDDDELRARLVARGRDRVAGLSWDRCAAGLAAIYRDAAG